MAHHDAGQQSAVLMGTGQTVSAALPTTAILERFVRGD
jgi:hypothetical protein